jgi:surfeit locus 1 family protein
MWPRRCLVPQDKVFLLLFVQKKKRFLPVIDRSKLHRIKSAAIAAFILFWVLIALGVWQLYRLQWKEGILAAIHQAEISAPIPLPAHPNRFQKVVISGHWMSAKAVLYGDEVHDTPTGPIEGGQLVMPFMRDTGQPILVDVGWVHEQAPEPAAEPTGKVSVVGYIHKSEAPGWFVGADQPSLGLYYTLNPEKIATAMGISGIAPFALIEIGPLPPPGSPLPQPAQGLPRPPNNHYEYALTWFGFSIVLVIEFLLFARKRLLEP